MITPQGHLANHLRALEKLECFPELAPRAAYIREMLECDRLGEVIRRERSLANCEHAPPKLLRYLVPAARLIYRRETREHRGHFRMILALAALDGEQAL
jgi:hypothetical protein